MKGGGGGYFYGLKMKQLSLFFIVFICASIVVWNWEKTPPLTTLLPPDDQVLQPFTDELKREHVTQEKDDLKEVEPVVDLALPSLSTNTASLNARQDEHPRTSHDKHHENTKIVVEKFIPEGYNGSKSYQPQLVASVNSETTESAVREGIDTPKTNLEKQACNLGKGKWVAADNRPLYSGFGCKQWLSGMWACRLTQRTDFGYEKLKWQPKDCKMDYFTKAKFLKKYVMRLFREINKSSHFGQENLPLRHIYPTFSTKSPPPQTTLPQLVKGPKK